MKKKTLVLGASMEPSRYSNILIHRLHDAGYPIVAIGRNMGFIADVPITDSKEKHEDVDTVTMYINPLHQKEYYDYIIGLRPKRVIFNPGSENPEFYPLLKNAGIEVEEACSLVLLATNQY